MSALCMPRPKKREEHIESAQHSRTSAAPHHTDKWATRVHTQIHMSTPQPCGSLSTRKKIVLHPLIPPCVPTLHRPERWGEGGQETTWHPNHKFFWQSR